MTRYCTIVADPPWPIDDGGTAPTSSWGRPRPGRLPYERMDLRGIEELVIPAEDDAHLYLWTINAYLEASYSVVRAWGFRPVVLLTWAKTPRGIGLGGTFTQTTEHVLFARKGSLQAKRRLDTTWFQWPRGAHSQKPEAFLDLVESVSPGPYLEMFARRARFGWDYWGDESLGHVELSA